MSPKFGPVKTKEANKTSEAEEVPQIYKIHKAPSQDHIGSLTIAGEILLLNLQSCQGTPGISLPLVLRHVRMNCLKTQVLLSYLGPCA